MGRLKSDGRRETEGDEACADGRAQESEGEEEWWVVVREGERERGRES